MYFKEEDVPASGKYKNHKEAPKPILIAIVTTAILTIGLFIYPDPVLDLAYDFANEPTLENYNLESQTSVNILEKEGLKVRILQNDEIPDSLRNLSQ